MTVCCGMTPRKQGQQQVQMLRSLHCALRARVEMTTVEVGAVALGAIPHPTTVKLSRGWGTRQAFPQRLKPDCNQGTYVRAEARTLQCNDFFNSLFNPTRATVQMLLRRRLR
jgi:hypothetical protein